MKFFYSVGLNDKFASILKVSKKNKLYRIEEKFHLDIEELPSFLADKKNIFVVVDMDHLLDETVAVPAALKKRKIIEAYIVNRFKSSLTTKNLLINLHKISEDKEEKKVTYKVDAIDKVLYMKKLAVIQNRSEIMSATIDKFALLSITKQCFLPNKERGFFSVYTFDNTITFLAFDADGQLLFDRKSIVSKREGVEQNVQFQLVNEIHQTMAYVTQQFRTTQFDTILLSGSLVVDDEITEQLLLASDIHVAALYPNTLVQGFEAEEAQDYIVSLGALFVKKQDMFLLPDILGYKQYKIAVNALLGLSMLALTVTLYDTVMEYLSYSQTYEQYSTTKNRLINLVKKTDTYSLEELGISFKQLNIAERFLQSHPSDPILELRSLIELLKPKSYRFEKKEPNARYRFEFEKHFANLYDLYRFELEFRKRFSDLNRQKKLTLTEKTDYAKLVFRTIVETKKEQTGMRQVSRRRRRR